MVFYTTTLYANRYELHDELGRGGMGSVYRATDRLTGNTVALKRVTAPLHQLGITTHSATIDLRLALTEEFSNFSIA